MTSKVAVVKNVTVYAAYLLLIWAFYRFLFQLPEDIEELVVKPVVWLIPLFYFVRKEGLGLASLGITLRNLFPAIYFGIGLGAIFVMEGVLTNFLKYGGFHFAANLGNLPFATSLGLSFATAFSEEVSFRGYIFGRLLGITGNEWQANLLSTILWTLIHVPIAFFIWKLNLSAGILYLALTAIFGAGSAFIFARTKNVFGSVLLHVLWEWPIILFR